jgi:hypothetical protein
MRWEGVRRERHARESDVLRTVGLAAALGIVCAFGAGSSAQAASPGYCAHYAQLAVWQFRRSRTCFGAVNRMWHPSYRTHYGWCLGVPEGAAREQDAIRGARLHACGY